MVARPGDAARFASLDSGLWRASRLPIRAKAVETPLAGVAMAAMYLLSPSLSGTALSEFHTIALAPPLVLLGAYFLDRRQYAAFAVCAVALLAFQEQMGLVLGVWGLVIATTHRTARGISFGLTLAVLSLGWFWYSLGLVIPGAGGPALRLSDLSWLTRSGEELIGRLTLASRAHWSFLLRSESVRYVGGLLQETGYLAFLSPLALLPAIPVLMANLLSPSTIAISEAAHYSILILPFLVIASVLGLGSLLNWLQRWSPRLLQPMPASALGTAMVGLMVWSASTHHLAVGVGPWLSDFQAPRITAHDERLSEFLERIPKESAVSAQSALTPHLSQRPKLYLFPDVRDADYVLFDVTTPAFPVSNEELWYQAQLLLTSKQFGVEAASGGFLLLKRGASSQALPEEFYSFAFAEANEVRYPLVATFDGEVQMLGFDVEMGKPDYDGHQITLDTYWRALREPRADYRVDVRVGDVALGGSAATTTWLPMGQWSPGRIIKITFQGLFIPNQRDVEVALRDPRQPDLKDSRLVLSETALPALALDRQSALRLFSLSPWFIGPEQRSLTDDELATPPLETVATRGQQVSPLCGRTVEDESLLSRRPVLAKIDNAPQARPQSGLSSACLVYEYMAEGGITRFGAGKVPGSV
jgi:uncharacterized membrane protein